MTEPARRLGSALCADDQRYVLSRYVHRFTRDNKPAWARGTYSNNLNPEPRPYPVQFAGDSDWLAHTEFRVTKSGRIHKGRFDCYSRPTWPDNPELRNGARVNSSSRAVHPA